MQECVKPCKDPLGMSLDIYGTYRICSQYVSARRSVGKERKLYDRKKNQPHILSVVIYQCCNEGCSLQLLGKFCPCFRIWLLIKMDKFVAERIIFLSIFHHLWNLVTNMQYKLAFWELKLCLSNTMLTLYASSYTYKVNDVIHFLKYMHSTQLVSLSYNIHFHFYVK